MRTDRVISNLPSVRDRLSVVGKDAAKPLSSITSVEVIRPRDAEVIPFAIKDPLVYCESTFHTAEDESTLPLVYTVAYYNSVVKNNARYSDKGTLISIYA